MQEGVGVEVEVQEGAAAFDFEAMEGLHRRARLALGRAKGREVVRPQERRRGLAHRLERKRPRFPAHPAGERGRAHRRIVEHVAVVAGDGAIARVKRLGYGPGRTHRHVFGQMGIHAPHPGVRRSFGLRVEMHHLGERMHSAIRASGAMQAHRLRGEYRDRRLQHRLHRAPLCLHLPAEKPLPGVFDEQCPAHRASPPPAGESRQALLPRIRSMSCCAAARCVSSPSRSTSSSSSRAPSVSPISR